MYLKLLIKMCRKNIGGKLEGIFDLMKKKIMKNPKK